MFWKKKKEYSEISASEAKRIATQQYEELKLKRRQFIFERIDILASIGKFSATFEQNSRWDGNIQFFDELSFLKNLGYKVTLTRTDANGKEYYEVSW